MAAKSTTETDKMPPPTASKNADKKPLPVTNSQKVSSAVNSGLSKYRSAQRVRKIGTHLQKVVGTFDPTGTLAEVDDVYDSDMSMSDSDGDNDSIYSENSDDEIIYSDGNIQDCETYDNAKSQTSDAPLKPGPGKGASKLPQTQSSKPAPQTKIVKVKKPDGTIVTVRRTIKPATASTSTIHGEPKVACVATIDPKMNIELQVKEESGLTTKTTRTGITVYEMEKLDDISQDLSKKLETKVEILQRRTSKATQIIVWSIMISFPLFFIILAILTASVHKKPKDDPIGLKITQINKIAVSLWPIAYAAVVAQALRMYASYKVETGIRLMTLEQLISSHSLASAIKQPFLLQRVNWTSIALLCLWSLSPLAGQALLRMSHLEPSGKLTQSTFYYLNSSAFPATGVGHDPESASYLMEVDQFLAVTILSPTETQDEAMDLWGNIKIPAIEPLESGDSDETYNIEGSPVYSSLIGIPILGIPQDNSTSQFSLNSSYFALDCPIMNIGNWSVVNETLTDIGISTILGISSSNATVLGMIPGAKDSPDVSDTVGKFFFASEIAASGAVDGSDPDYSYMTCTYNLTHVVSNVDCLEADCSVTQIKRVTGPEYDNALASAFGPEADYAFVNGFANSGSNYQTYTFSPITNYLLDPSTAGHPDFNTATNLSTVPIDTLTTRLSTLLNTYWLASVGTYAINNNLQLNNTNMTTQYTDAVINATIISESLDQVYFTNWGWLTVLLASSVLLLLGGIVGAICDSHTIGPDIFGFASSLAHRNKYMRVPTGDSTMSGAKRARMLGHVEVMLQDVRPHQEIGKIALGTVENGGEKLKHGRLYK